MVNSQSNSGTYLVSWHSGRWECDCDDFLSGHICKHTASVRFALLLPHVLSSNAGVQAGSDVDDGSRPFVSCDGRAVDVRKLITAYRSMLAEINAIGDVARLPRPKLTRREGR
jgi:hypothetical protein